ncbi:DUF6444 domain-containing protein [Parafrankia discariae]|uniref:DUF6444 domain-containing protein n=1 Tax=Parafrankia discariae TaxID=365528 RepID=UPI002DDB01D0|nr:DUF6444 domain-containing protein [Parafrankia discariae]
MVERAGLIARSRAELEQARARIAELEPRVAKTSRNSAKPPRSDGLAKPAPKSLRKKTGRRPGGQAGIRDRRCGWSPILTCVCGMSRGRAQGAGRRWRASR